MMLKLHDAEITTEIIYGGMFISARAIAAYKTVGIRLIVETDFIKLKTEKKLPVHFSNAKQAARFFTILRRLNFYDNHCRKVMHQYSI